MKTNQKTLREKQEVLKHITTRQEAGYDFTVMADNELEPYSVALCWKYDAMKQSGLVKGYRTYDLYFYDTAEEAWAALLEWQEAVHEVNVELMEKGVNK